MESKQSQLSFGRVSRRVMWPRLVRSVAGRGVAVWCLGLWLLASLLPGVATAQTTLTWGVNGAGGSGTWDVIASNWWNGSSNVVWTDTSSRNAVFAGTAGSVTMAGNRTAGAVQFNTAGYTLFFGAGTTRQLTLASLGGSAIASTTFVASSTLTSGVNSVIFNYGANELTFAGTVADNGLGNRTNIALQSHSSGRFIFGEGTNYTATGAFSMTGSSPVRLATISGLPTAFEHAAASTSVVELAAGDFSRDFVGAFTGTTNQFRTRGGSLGFAAIGGDRSLTMSNAADITWDSSGGNINASSLTLATADSTGKLTLAAGAGRSLRLQNSTTGTVTREIRADNGTAAIDAEIAVSLADGTTAVRIGGINKTGAGVLALSAVNTYTGPTTVSAGGLLVNGTTAAASAFTVSSGAFLGGIGRVGGDVTVNGGIAPGSNGIGTLTTGSGVTWNAGDSWLFQLGTPAVSLNAASSSTDSDLLNVAGAFNAGTGSSFTFDFANTGSDGWYKLIDYTTTNFATGTNTSFTANNVPSGKTANFVVDSASSAVYVQIVPEPGTLALAGIGAAVAVWAIRRRRPA